MKAETPPLSLRADISVDERRLIERQLGEIADDSLVRAVRDGRGRHFQRLEFLGDSVLDVVLAVHGWVEPECHRCAGHDVLSGASDRQLALVAAQAGVGEWLEWRASPERVGDLVETCVAACWLNGGWSQVISFVSRVIHPVGLLTEQVLSGGGPCRPGRAARRAASAVLELAAAHEVFVRLPGADEGELSTARA